MSKLPYRSFKSIKTEKELSDYFSDRALNHSNKYYHYTTLDTISSIIEKKQFRLSCVSRFNDTNDSNQFGEDACLFYAMCFCVGKRENLPLWYLYSGVDGKGGRLGFTASALKKILDEAKFMFCEYDYNHPPEDPQGEILERGKDFEWTAHDVLYVNFDVESPCVMRYSNLVNEEIPAEEAKKYLAKHPGFKKDLIWSYEKETRLLIKLIGEKANQVAANKDKTYAVFLKFGDPSKRMSLEVAPERQDKAEVLNDYPVICEFEKQGGAVALSAYKGQIKMNLQGKQCETCEYKKSKKKESKK